MFARDSLVVGRVQSPLPDWKPPMALHLASQRDIEAQTVAPYALDLPRGTPVMTMQGVMPIEHLLPGDRVITRAGAVPLVAVAALPPAPVAIVRVSARALGHDRPAEDICLPADQPILIRDWRAKALFGQLEAVVPLSRLIDGAYVQAAPVATLPLIRLGLPRATVVQAAGLELATPALEVPAGA